MPADVERALRLLGLATRAGRTRTGTQACGITVRRGLARMVWIAGDAAPDGAEKMKQLCRQHKVIYRQAADSARLGQYTGKEYRTVVAVTDDSFAETIARLLTEDTTQETQG